jgi:hypothetical protein
MPGSISILSTADLQAMTMIREIIKGDEGIELIHLINGAIAQESAWCAYYADEAIAR